MEPPIKGIGNLQRPLRTEFNLAMSITVDRKAVLASRGKYDTRESTHHDWWIDWAVIYQQCQI